MSFTTIPTWLMRLSMGLSLSPASLRIPTRNVASLGYPSIVAPARSGRGQEVRRKHEIRRLSVRGALDGLGGERREGARGQGVGHRRVASRQLHRRLDRRPALDGGADQWTGGR